MIAPGSTIGIIGGGQLGRMLALAAAKLGFKAHVYCQNEMAPAFDVTRYGTVSDFDDPKAMAEFARSVDLVTFEFENIPTTALEVCAQHGPVYPGVKALAKTQDRLIEKQFIEAAGVPCAPYAAFESPEELKAALKLIGRPAVAKRRLSGYDGKGQMIIRSPKDARAAEEAYDGIPSVLEKFIPFDREVSVIVARSVDGDVAAYPVSENIHENHILARTTVPAKMSDAMEAKAKVIATKLANALDFVGIMAVEMFVLDESGGLLVNEIAPRVHNTGHWTIEGAVTSQFEQHIRAICGLPLGKPDALGRVRMVNLLGEAVLGAEVHMADGQAHYHNYGKSPLREGRKTGHITWVEQDKA